MPIFKQHPRDFVVEEVALYPPDGEGSHCLVYVEKEGLNTEQLVTGVAERAGVDRRDIGYAGRKDRWALTRQWLSVPNTSVDEASAWEGEGWRVLETEAHRQKLRVGHLRANHFTLRVRSVDADTARAAKERLQQAEEKGFANRFGDQRFGRHGGNAEKARRMLAGEIKIRNRRMARFLVSALQSEAFNLVLERRHRIVPPLDGELSWERLVDGDIAQIVASGGSFLVRDAAAEQSRMAAREIVPTGPMPGSKVLRAAGRVGELEHKVFEEMGCADLVQGRIPRLRVDGGRRVLAVRPSNCRFEYAAKDKSALIEFSLPSGCYATVLLEELFGKSLEDASRPAGALTAD